MVLRRIRGILVHKKTMEKRKLDGVITDYYMKRNSFSLCKIRQMRQITTETAF